VQQDLIVITTRLLQRCTLSLWD